MCIRYSRFESWDTKSKEQRKQKASAGSRSYVSYSGITKKNSIMSKHPHQPISLDLEYAGSHKQKGIVISPVRTHVKKILICRPRPSGFHRSENRIFTELFLPNYFYRIILLKPFFEEKQLISKGGLHFFTIEIMNPKQ